jgi:DNA-binding CsgD family transcriptional regulator
MISVEIFHMNNFWKQGMDFLLRDINDIYIKKVSGINKLPSVNVILADQHIPTDFSRDDRLVIPVYSSLQKSMEVSTSRYPVIYSSDTPDDFIKKFILIIRCSVRSCGSYHYPQVKRSVMLNEIELLVLNNLLDGLSHETVALNNDINIKSVSYYKRSAMRKLNVSTTKSLLDMLYQTGHRTRSI